MPGGSGPSAGAARLLFCAVELALVGTTSAVLVVGFPLGATLVSVLRLNRHAIRRFSTDKSTHRVPATDPALK